MCIGGEETVDKGSFRNMSTMACLCAALDTEYNLICEDV